MASLSQARIRTFSNKTLQGARASRTLAGPPFGMRRGCVAPGGRGPGRGVGAGGVGAGGRGAGGREWPARARAWGERALTGARGPPGSRQLV